MESCVYCGEDIEGIGINFQGELRHVSCTMDRIRQCETELAQDIAVTRDQIDWADNQNAKTNPKNPKNISGWSREFEEGIR